MTSLSGEEAKTQQKCLFIREPNLPLQRQLEEGGYIKGFQISNKRLKISFHYLIQDFPSPVFVSMPALDNRHFL